MLAEIDGRLRRIEETLSRLTAAQGQLGRAMNATLFAIGHLGDHRALTFLQNGQKMFVDTRSIDVGTHLLLDGWWEPDYMAAFSRLLKPGQCVLDIGANHGIYALVAAQRVGPRGKVVAFEPNAQLCDLLRASVSVNGLEKIVEVVQCAVGDSDGEADARIRRALGGPRAGPDPASMHLRRPAGQARDRSGCAASPSTVSSPMRSGRWIW